jgi:hypothetical protein
VITAAIANKKMLRHLRKRCRTAAAVVAATDAKTSLEDLPAPG